MYVTFNYSYNIEILKKTKLRNLLFYFFSFLTFYTLLNHIKRFFLMFARFQLKNLCDFNIL